MFSKLLIWFIIFLNVNYVIGVLYVMSHGAAEPAALTVAWFAWTTGELWMLASIKKTKVRDIKEKKRREGKNEHG